MQSGPEVAAKQPASVPKQTEAEVHSLNMPSKNYHGNECH